MYVILFVENRYVNIKIHLKYIYNFDMYYLCITAYI